MSPLYICGNVHDGILWHTRAKLCSPFTCSILFNIFYANVFIIRGLWINCLRVYGSGSCTHFSIEYIILFRMFSIQIFQMGKLALNWLHKSVIVPFVSEIYTHICASPYIRFSRITKPHPVPEWEWIGPAPSHVHLLNTNGASLSICTAKVLFPLCFLCYFPIHILCFHPQIDAVQSYPYFVYLDYNAVRVCMFGCVDNFVLYFKLEYIHDVKKVKRFRVCCQSAALIQFDNIENIFSMR